MSIPLFERVHSEVAQAVAALLGARSTSIFARMGEPRCRDHVDRVLFALEQDLAAGKRERVRSAMQALIEALADEGLTFSDLRFFALTLRSTVEAEAEGEAEALRHAIDDWFFELVLVGTMRFVVQREAQIQARSAKLELEQLENQLVDLQKALSEKTRLLEMVRQASTPIAPVVQGILVVPLVGGFDAFRAELLNERLLHEIGRLRARAVILDISGVPVFDTEAAQLIIRLARTVRLLGTEVFVVGMSPEGARTIVDLGIDLSGLQTLATLREGLAAALRLQRLAIKPM